jgi:hypothetical protein
MAQKTPPPETHLCVAQLSQLHGGSMTPTVASPRARPWGPSAAADAQWGRPDPAVRAAVDRWTPRAPLGRPQRRVDADGRAWAAVVFHHEPGDDGGRALAVVLAAADDGGWRYHDVAWLQSTDGWADVPEPATHRVAVADDNDDAYWAGYEGPDEREAAVRARVTAAVEAGRGAGLAPQVLAALLREVADAIVSVSGTDAGV